jgi:hypothetical protein
MLGGKSTGSSANDSMKKLASTFIRSFANPSWKGCLICEPHFNIRFHGERSNIDV